MLITLTVNAETKTNSEFNFNSEFIALETNQLDLELEIFSDLYDQTLAVEDIEIVELEEDIEIDFDTTEYLPENFNALAGKNDIDWSKVELIELEEDIEIGFNTKDYLPRNFDPYQGMDCKKDVVVSLY
jgi:hypothetical protein